MPLSGVCLCEAVRLDVAVKSENTVPFQCHCKSCRQMTGGYCSTNIKVAPEALTVHCVDALLCSTREAERGCLVYIYRCPSCFTVIYAYSDLSVNLYRVIPIGIIAENGELPSVGVELFVSRRLNNVPPVAGAQQFAVRPDSSASAQPTFLRSMKS